MCSRIFQTPFYFHFKKFVMGEKKQKSWLHFNTCDNRHKLFVSIIFFWSETARSGRAQSCCSWLTAIEITRKKIVTKNISRHGMRTCDLKQKISLKSRITFRLDHFLLGLGNLSEHTHKENHFQKKKKLL